MRLLLRWVLNALALFGIAYVAPILGMLPNFRVDNFTSAILAVAVLAVLNLTVKPILQLLTLPITCLTFGLFTLVLNAVIMEMTTRLVPGFHTGGWLNAFMASIIYAILSTIVNILLKAKDE